jgi:hypothetical protein
MNLPPLPDDIEAWIEPMTTEELQAAFREYGEACRKQALEEAAQKCHETRHPWGYSSESSDWCSGTDHCAAAIRSLIK